MQSPPSGVSESRPPCLIGSVRCPCVSGVINFDDAGAFIRGLHSLQIVFRAGSEDIDDLKQRVVDGVSKLKGLDVGDELAVEILGQLVQGRRTLTEITEGIYGLSRSDEGFRSSFNRVGREVRRLESKGLVSRKLFGNNKPCRLTQLAIINLARIGGEEQQLPVVSRVDLIPYLSTIGISVFAVLHSRGFVSLPEMGTLGLFVLFGFAAGISFCRVLQTIRRVF